MVLAYGIVSIHTMDTINTIWPEQLEITVT